MKDVIIIAGGGHTHSLMDALEAMQCKILGYLDVKQDAARDQSLGITYLGNDSSISNYSPKDVLLVNGLGSDKKLDLRKKIFLQFKQAGFSFLTVIHPSAVISPRSFVDEGSQIMAGAILQPGARIGKNCIINTRASVDHDCVVGDHVHIAPGVSISGSVSVGESTHIGTGASIINGISVGKECLIAAGAVVVKNIPDATFFAGVPAVEKRRAIIL